MCPLRHQARTLPFSWATTTFTPPFSVPRLSCVRRVNLCPHLSAHPLCSGYRQASLLQVHRCSGSCRGPSILIQLIPCLRLRMLITHPSRRFLSRSSCMSSASESHSPVLSFCHHWRVVPYRDYDRTDLITYLSRASLRESFLYQHYFCLHAHHGGVGRRELHLGPWVLGSPDRPSGTLSYHLMYLTSGHDAACEDVLTHK